MTQIETESQYKWAMERVEELLPLVKDDTPCNDPASIELELLSELVADYSDKHFALESPALVDVIKLRMYERGLTQKSLAKLLGISEARVSEVMTGKCKPTYEMARDISLKLDIDAAVVLGV
ncbi:MAG: helix-turn-helix domain-containing protein [Bacteroidales bacterium]